MTSNELCDAIATGSFTNEQLTDLRSAIDAKFQERYAEDKREFSLGDRVKWKSGFDGSGTMTGVLIDFYLNTAVVKTDQGRYWVSVSLLEAA